MQRTLNLSDFLKHLDTSRADALARTRRVIQRVAYTCAENIVVGGEYAPGTPVDTGLARSSWHIQLNNRALPPMRSAPVRGHSGAVRGEVPGTATVASFGLGDVLYILNNVAYIRSLEYGHSKQAPRGMVRLTLAAAKQIVRKAVAIERRR